MYVRIFLACSGVLCDADTALYLTIHVHPDLKSGREDDTNLGINNTSQGRTQGITALTESRGPGVWEGGPKEGAREFQRGGPGAHTEFQTYFKAGDDMV